MIKTVNKNEIRKRIHERVRKKIKGTAEMPRLCVYRSTVNIYAQIIDDVKGATLVSASSLDKELKDVIAGKTKKEQAEQVGKLLAKRALEKKIETVVFDRGGYLYTGRVQNLADGARAGGLKF